MIQEEDTQAINEPIVGVERTKEFDMVERGLPETTFSYEFMKFLMKNMTINKFQYTKIWIPAKLSKPYLKT